MKRSSSKQDQTQNNDSNDNNNNNNQILNNNDVDAYVRFRRKCSYHFIRMKNYLKKHCCCCCIPSDEVLALTQNDEIASSSTPEIDLELQPVELVDDDVFSQNMSLRNVSSIHPLTTIKITEKYETLNTSKLHKKTINYMRNRLIAEFNKKTKMDFSKDRQHEENDQHEEDGQHEEESYEQEIESQRYFNLYVTPLSELRWYNSWIQHCQRYNLPYQPRRSDNQNFGDWFTNVKQSIQFQLFDHLLNFIDGLMAKKTIDAKCSFPLASEDEEQMFYRYFNESYHKALRQKNKIK